MFRQPSQYDDTDAVVGVFRPMPLCWALRDEGPVDEVIVQSRPV